MRLTAEPFLSPGLTLESPYQESKAAGPGGRGAELAVVQLDSPSSQPVPSDRSETQRCSFAISAAVLSS